MGQPAWPKKLNNNLIRKYIINHTRICYSCYDKDHDITDDIKFSPRLMTTDQFILYKHCSHLSFNYMDVKLFSQLTRPDNEGILSVEYLIVIIQVKR